MKSILTLMLCGLFIGGMASFFYREKSQRLPASGWKNSKFVVKPWADSLSAKAHQAMTVHVFAVGGVPDHDGQDLRLRAEVTLNRPVDQEVSFQWQLPSGAALVSGEREDAWAGLQPGQTASTEIVVTGISKESVAKTVTFHVSSLSNGINFGSSGSFATNSAEHMQAEQAVGFMTNQNSKLVLKKSETPVRIKKLHQ